MNQKLQKNKKQNKDRRKKGKENKFLRVSGPTMQRGVAEQETPKQGRKEKNFGL